MERVQEDGGRPAAEEYVKMHQKAFRCAFDFLNAHFPPAPEPEWWNTVAGDVEKADRECGSVICRQLLLGVYNYLEHEWKERYGNADY